MEEAPFSHIDSCSALLRQITPDQAVQHTVVDSFLHCCITVWTLHAWQADRGLAATTASMHPPLCLQIQSCKSRTVTGTATILTTER